MEKLDTYKRQMLADVMKKINCKDCDNFLCGANGMDMDVLCFYGPLSRAKKEAREDV